MGKENCFTRSLDSFHQFFPIKLNKPNPSCQCQWLFIHTYCLVSQLWKDMLEPSQSGKGIIVKTFWAILFAIHRVSLDLCSKPEVLIWLSHQMKCVHLWERSPSISSHWSGSSKHQSGLDHCAGDFRFWCYYRSPNCRDFHISLPQTNHPGLDSAL